MPKNEVILKLLDCKIRDEANRTLEDILVFPDSLYSEAMYEKTYKLHRKFFGRYDLIEEFKDREPKEFTYYESACKRILLSLQK